MNNGYDHCFKTISTAMISLHHLPLPTPLPPPSSSLTLPLSTPSLPAPANPHGAPFLSPQTSTPPPFPHSSTLTVINPSSQLGGQSSGTTLTPAPYSDHTFVPHRHQQQQRQQQKEGRLGGIAGAVEEACGPGMGNGWLGVRSVKGVKRRYLRTEWGSGEEKRE